MSRTDILRPDVESALRPGLSPAQYAQAVRELDRSYGLRSMEWRELLERGVPYDPIARRMLFETLTALGADIIPLLVFDVEHAAGHMAGQSIAHRAESLRATLPPGTVHGDPTGLPCLRCGSCALERLAERSQAEWTETDLRCGSCSALHVGYGDEHFPARDLVLLESDASH